MRCRAEVVNRSLKADCTDFTHTGRFISVPLCSEQSELASICLFVQFDNQLDV